MLFQFFLYNFIVCDHYDTGDIFVRFFFRFSPGRRCCLSSAPPNYCWSEKLKIDTEKKKYMKISIKGTN